MLMLVAGLLVLILVGLGLVLDAQLANKKQDALLAAETHRLLSRLIELETTKQAQRASGRDLLRERIKERLAKAGKG
jgi:hypothetical protein